VKWAEIAAERESELELAQREAEELARDPEGELAELTDHWRDRGLDPVLAGEVARQLMARDPVAAHLDSEYGLEEITPRAAPWWAGIEAAVAFMIGAAIPVVMTYVAPVAIEGWVILIAVVVSLTLTSLVAAGLGRLSAFRMLGRSLIVGLGTMAVSYLAGLVFF
jgi:VIT1/CCC1 family predicted Fe2+/Mn2+ transporter